MNRGVGRPPDRPRLPNGAAVCLDPTTMILADGAVLLGGRPRRLLRLHAAVRGKLIDRRLVVTDARTAHVARRLLDSGLGHPDFSAESGPEPGGHAHNHPKSGLDSDVMRITCDLIDLDIVIPVRDRPGELARLLAAIRADPETTRARITVVDDGSRDPTLTAEISQRAGAELVRHDRSRGPAAARNTGLAAGTAPTVAFLDSDCVPVPGWLELLVRHLQDPAVALVAPRIVAVTIASDHQPFAPDSRVQASWLSSYERVASALDLGAACGRVEPGLPVSYVPSAALLARRTAVGTGFDDAMTVAEDVDLVWRLVDAGWTVRYEPAAEVAHEHRTRAGAFMIRRTYYGTGAALLARRHGSSVAPVVIQPWTAVAWIGILIARRWSLALSVGALSLATLRLARTLAAAEVPAASPIAADLIWGGSASAARSLLRPPGREYWPLAVVGAAVCPAVRRRLLITAVLDAALGWWPHRRTTSFWGFLAARRLEDLAYGTGVWYGALRDRSLGALRPRIQRPR